MRIRVYLPFVCFLIAVSFPCIGAAAGAGSPQLPFAFVENKGQYEAGVRYIGNGPEFKAWFRDGGVTFQHGAAVAAARFVGGRANPRIEALDPIGATANYLRGGDP